MSKESAAHVGRADGVGFGREGSGVVGLEVSPEALQFPDGRKLVFILVKDPGRDEVLIASERVCPIMEVSKDHCERFNGRGPTLGNEATYL